METSRAEKSVSAMCICVYTDEDRCNMNTQEHMKLSLNESVLYKFITDGPWFLKISQTEDFYITFYSILSTGDLGTFCMQKGYSSVDLQHLPNPNIKGRVAVFLFMLQACLHNYMCKHQRIIFNLVSKSENHIKVLYLPPFFAHSSFTTAATFDWSFPQAWFLRQRPGNFLLPRAPTCRVNG